MVKTIKIAGMDAYIKKFTPDTSNSAATETPAASEGDSKSVKTTKKSTVKK